MSTNQTAVTKGIIGIVLGAASILGGTELAMAASDYKVIHKQKVAIGDWEHHQPWYLMRFYLPKDFDPNYHTVLQMNISSTNKSKYNAIYLNPDVVPGEFNGCDPIGQDRNEAERIGWLPYVHHNRWHVYHKIVDGAYLQPGDNYLLVCSRNQHGHGGQHLDSYYLEDIVLHYREYEPPPQACSRLFEPVCGADDVTYNNACEADQAEVEILYEGSCSTR